MTLTINGETQDSEAQDLAQLVAQLGLADAIVATAVNGVFVNSRVRPDTALHDGDKVEIVAPMQGG